MKMPNTPFSTRLSGSAKETELRIRNIFQWKKKRPPVIVLVLVAALLLGICGGLVAFRSTPRNGTLAELYPEYFAKGAIRQVCYFDKEDFGKPDLEQGTEGFSAAMKYLETVELRSVWGNRRYIDNFGYRNGAFYLVNEQEVPLVLELYPDGYVVISTGWDSSRDYRAARVFRAEAFDKAELLALWTTSVDQSDVTPPTDGSKPGDVTVPDDKYPAFTVSVDELVETMEKIETEEAYPAEVWNMEVTGLSVPVTLTMHLDLVTEAEAYGQSVILTEPLDIYGNCNFDLFEADGAVILEGGYYWIGDIYVLSPDGCSEVHPGEEASYYLYIDDQGNLKYRLSHNEIATITQTGALWVATRYGELLSAHGDASIVNGEVVIAEPDEQKFIDYERLWKEFENGGWSERYHSVEEILENNRAQKEGREPSPIYSTEYRDQLICDYYTRTYQRGVYMAHEMPEQVQQGNERIDEIVVLGETRVYEVTGQLLEIYKSRYDGSDWNRYSSYLVITKGIDNAYEQIIGTAYIREGQTAEEVILEKVHGLSDLEVSLWREGYPWPVGPGSQIHIYREAYDGPETVEILEGWEPIYQEGDYWAARRWNGVEALCYCRLENAQTGYYDVRVNTFDTTRTDLRTYRGIRVGDSRAKVMETYPELKSGDYWGKYPGEDYLWYCTSEQDFGAALIFFFEDDTVSRIVLNDMFN